MSLSVHERAFWNLHWESANIMLQLSRLHPLSIETKSGGVASIYYSVNELSSSCSLPYILRKLSCGLGGGIHLLGVQQQDRNLQILQCVCSRAAKCRGIYATPKSCSWRDAPDVSRNQRLNPKIVERPGDSSLSPIEHYLFQDSCHVAGQRDVCTRLRSHWYCTNERATQSWLKPLS